MPSCCYGNDCQIASTGSNYLLPNGNRFISSRRQAVPRTIYIQTAGGKNVQLTIRISHTFVKRHFHKGEPSSSCAVGRGYRTKSEHWNCKFLKHTEGTDGDSMWENTDLFPKGQKRLGPTPACHNTRFSEKNRYASIFFQRQNFINNLAIHVLCTMILSWCLHSFL